jgi:uncharacterized protein YbjT (DUF2867 family)
VFPTFLRPDAAFDMVATADIGRVAADLLLSGGVPGSQIVNLASGSGPIAPRAIAAIVSKVVGKELAVVHAPAEAIVPTLSSYGMSTDVAGLYAEMIGAFNSSDADPWDRSAWFVRGPTTAESVLRGLLGR